MKETSVQAKNLAEYLQNFVKPLSEDLNLAIFKSIGKNQNFPVMASRDFALHCLGLYDEGNFSFTTLTRRVTANSRELNAANGAHRKNGINRVITEKELILAKKKIIDTSLRLIFGGLNFSYDINKEKHFLDDFPDFKKPFNLSQTNLGTWGTKRKKATEEWKRISYLGFATRFIPMKYYLMLVLDDILSYNEARIAAETLGDHKYYTEADSLA